MSFCPCAGAFNDHCCCQPVGAEVPRRHYRRRRPHRSPRRQRGPIPEFSLPDPVPSTSRGREHLVWWVSLATYRLPLPSVFWRSCGLCDAMRWKDFVNLGFRKHLLNFREQFYKVSSASNFGVRLDKAQTFRNQMNTEHSCEASLRRCGRSPALLPRRR